MQSPVKTTLQSSVWPEYFPLAYQGHRLLPVKILYCEVEIIHGCNQSLFTAILSFAFLFHLHFSWTHEP